METKRIVLGTVFTVAMTVAAGGPGAQGAEAVELRAPALDTITAGAVEVAGSSSALGGPSGVGGIGGPFGIGGPLGIGGIGSPLGVGGGPAGAFRGFLFRDGEVSVSSSSSTTSQ